MRFIVGSNASRFLSSRESVEYGYRTTIQMLNYLALSPFNRHWVLPVAFAGLPWIILRLMPPDWSHRVLKYVVGLRKSREEEECERKIHRLEDELSGAKDDHRKLTNELGQLKTAHQRALDDANATAARTLRREKEERAAAQKVLEDERNRALLQTQRQTAELGALRRQLDTKDMELRNACNELQHAHTKHDELAALLETRSRELKGAQVYLTKADTLSGAEVIGLVDALNVEIMQTSAFISDSFDFVRQQAHADEIKEASGRITELMGSPLTHLLGTVLHSEDPLLVQIALQGATVEFARWIIMTWDFDGLQAEQPLAEIYNDIRESETQAVGGRWRALTRAHAQKVALQEADLHGTMVAHISDTLVIILVASGCTKSYEEAYRQFTQKFGERISNIVKMASRLNKAMGEEVTSADLWPVNAASGDKFDKAAMDNFEANGEDSQGKPVLCTTALGLQRSEKLAQGETTEFKTTTLLKPKVAVESIADGLERDSA